MQFEIKNFQMLKNALKEICNHWKEKGLSEECIFDSKLIFSELVSNVLQHSQGIATICEKLDDKYLTISVYSTVPFIPPKTTCCIDVFSERGRGLFLVDQLCEKRFCEEDGTIKVVMRAIYDR